jgi:hypothetical protein
MSVKEKKTSPDRVPEPSRMPVDPVHWGSQLHLSNFINAYYQYRDLQGLGTVKSVLIVGPGQGLGANVLKWRGYEVTTLDIDDAFRPDFTGSVHEMKMFGDGRFDAVIASHVLEHLPVPFLDPALGEIARVGRHALIYLPVRGRHVQLRFLPAFRDLDLSLILDVFNRLEKPDGITPRYMAGQHFWEVGMRGFRVKDLVARMSKHFRVISVYRNRDWNPSQNFVLKSRVCA